MGVQATVHFLLLVINRCGGSLLSLFLNFFCEVSDMLKLQCINREINYKKYDNWFLFGPR